MCKSMATSISFVIKHDQEFSCDYYSIIPLQPNIIIGIGEPDDAFSTRWVGHVSI